MRAPWWVLSVVLGCAFARVAMADDACAPGSECWALLRTVDAGGQHAANLASASQALQGETEALREFIANHGTTEVRGVLSVDPAPWERLARAIETLAHKGDGMGAPGAPVQLDPRDDLRRYYGPEAHVKAFVVAVPDPRVPRLRRSFDLVVAALIQAGATANYQFSRYVYPWRVTDPNKIEEDVLLRPQPSQPQLQAWHRCELIESVFDLDAGDPLSIDGAKLTRAQLREGRQYCRDGRDAVAMLCRDPRHCPGLTPPVSSDAKARSDDGIVPLLPRGEYGLIVMRRTRHGTEACGKNVDPFCIDLLAMYLVPERLSFGVEPNALIQAALRAASQQAPVDQGDHDSPPAHEPVVLIGPGVSGSLTGLIQVSRRLKDLLPSMLVVDSPTINANSNLTLGLTFAHVPKSPDKVLCRSAPDLVKMENSPKFEPMHAWSEIDKCDALAKALGAIDLKQVLDVAENSEWGFSGVFDEDVDQLRVPPNIWETTLGDKHEDIKNERVRALLPDAELALNHDVGSEFPSRFSQALTAKVDSMALEHLWRSAIGKSVIWIRMTDVRDQLYVARQLRKWAPGALLVFPESDELLAHPDYMDDLRGAWVFANTALDAGTQNFRMRFATDDAAGYFAVLSGHLVENKQTSAGESRKEEDVPPRYLVTRAGLWGSWESSTDSQRRHENTLRGLVAFSLVALLLLIEQRVWRLCLSKAFRWGSESDDKMRATSLGLAALGIFILVCTDDVPMRTGLSIYNAAALCLFASATLFRLYRRRCDAVIEAKRWLLPSQMYLFESDWKRRSVQASAVVGLAVFGYAAWSTLPYRHPMGENGISWAISILLGGMLLGNFALQIAANSKVHRVTDLLMSTIGDVDAAIPQQWVGLRALQRYSTPFAAGPDPQWPWLAVVPRLGQLRRVRQVLGAAILIARWHSILGLILPLVVMLAVWSCPLPMQGVLLTCAALLLIGSTVLMHFTVVRIEREKLASAAFCANSGFHFGGQLATYLVAPVVATALGLWLAFLPGMREWTQHTLMPFVSLWI